MELFWTSFAGLFVVAGPWKAGVFFAESTLALPRRARYATACFTTLIATAVGALFVVFGEPLLEFFHISDAAFLIAAGLLVVVFSIRVVLQETADHETVVAVDVDARAVELAAYPLSFPLVITPPAIATLIALGVIANVDDVSLLAVLGALVAVQAFNLVVFLSLSRFEDRVSPTVFHIAGRLLAVLLTAFGVGIVIDGLRLLEVI